jgi:ketosteroid isomerase-like protein
MKLLCCFCLMLAVSAMAQENGPIETRIIAMEKAWNQAYNLRDKKALGQILDDSMVLVNDDGSLRSKGIFLASYDSAKPSDLQQLELESISVRVFGDVAIATGVFREKGVKSGKAYTRQLRFVDTWVSSNGSWECVAASATPVLH